MTAGPALIVVAAFLVGLAIGRAPLHALRCNLGWARRDLEVERVRADRAVADAAMWRKRANNAAARLNAPPTPTGGNVVPFWSNGRFRP